MKWIKIIILCCILSIISCRKIDVTPNPEPKPVDILTAKEVSVGDGESLNFILKTQGAYTMTLFDSVGQQVVARERIAGKIGQNTISFYTKTLPVRYLYLSIEDENNNEIGKTLLIIK